MTDLDLERRLSDYYHAEVGGLGASSELLERLTAIPPTSRGSLLPTRRGMVLLLAAALLLALVAGTVLTVGSLIREPELSYPPVHLPHMNVAASMNGCGGTLADTASEDTVIALSDSAGLAGRAMQEPEMNVSRNGYVLVSSGPVEGVDPAWSRRRLTPQGVHDLVSALVVPELPSCRSYVFGTPTIWVSVQADGDQYWIAAGTGRLQETHVTTSEQLSALVALHQRLQDPDLGLPPGDWATAAWATYRPARWRVDIAVHAGPGTAPLLTGDVLLPNGAPLREIGDYTATDGPAAYRDRCIVVGWDVAQMVIATAGSVGLQQAGYSWEFSNDLVSVEGLIGSGGGCPHGSEVRASQSLAPNGPTPAGLTACSYLTPAVVDRVMGDAGWLDDEFARPKELGWTECEYKLIDGVAQLENARVDVRSQTVPASEAPALARDLFGTEGLSSTRINGHAVFFNGCLRGNVGDDCLSAAAISMEPDFVVLVWDAATQDELQQLAEAVATGTAQ